jgi:hypothetical protein
MEVGCASPTRYTPVRSRRPKQNPTAGPSNRRGSGARYKQGASEPTRTLPPLSVGVSSIPDSDQSHLLFVDVLSSELMVRLFLALGLLALTTVAAAAQSWGMYSRIGLQRAKNFKEPCWSAAASKCAREQSRKVPARLKGTGDRGAAVFSATRR